MRVSVIIPAYNAASVIEETLDTVSSQTCTPHEVIVVDDGSVDGTAEVARAHSVVTRVIVRENGGICPARNDAIEQAEGDLIFNLDADDLWHPLYLEHMCEMMESNPRTASGFSNYSCWVEPDEDPLPFESDIPSDCRIHDGVGCELDKSSSLPILPSFHVFRRSALSKLGSRPYIENHRQGQSLYFIGVLSAIAPVAEHLAPLGRYRIHSAAVTGDEVNSARNIIPCIEDLRSFARDRKDLGLSRENQEQIEALVARWTRRCARRVGGGGHTAEGRSLLLRSFLRGDRKSGAMAAASLLPGLKHKVWCESWRPSSARRKEGTPSWATDTED